MANGRCKRHGGKSTGAKTPLTGTKNHARTHGIYEQFLTEDDRDLYNRAELGAVDAELRLMRMRLARTVKARTAWEASLAAAEASSPRDSDAGSEHMILVERNEDQAGGFEGSILDLEKKAFRLPDFDKIEHTTIARIESLEKTRKELAKAPEDDDDLPGDGTTRDRVVFSGGLGGDDEELPSPFEKPKP